MKFKRLIMAALVAILFALPTAQAAEIEIEVWAPADENERYRFVAISLAANVLNEELKIEGSDSRVVVKQGASFAGSQGWAQLKQGFSLAVEAGKGPHLIVGGHEDIPVWGSAGLIYPIEDYTDLEAWPFSDLFPSLWPIMSWNGQVWGAPQDAESRPFFAWNPHLKAIGYSDTDIAALPAKVKSGQYTLQTSSRTPRRSRTRAWSRRATGSIPAPPRGGLLAVLCRPEGRRPVRRQEWQADPGQGRPAWILPVLQ